MLSSIKKDKNRRALVKKFEIKRLHLKVLLQDLSLRKDFTLKRRSRFLNPIDLDSFLSQKALQIAPRNSSKTRVENRCIETGRSRAVLRFCKLSRICLRDKASKGAIPGISKASW